MKTKLFALLSTANEFWKSVGLVLSVLGSALLLYFLFLWPVPKHFDSGIPFTVYNVEKQDVMTLVPGDHLQLMYHFGLARKMISGEIPLFSNLYEFNLGVDAERKILDPYYLPYSLAFSAVAGWFGDAAGWNFAQLLSVLVGFALLFLLARRYSGDDNPIRNLSALSAAFVATCIPYRWVSLADGSPTGFGISLISGFVLGIDIAVRDSRVRGGVLAGVMLLLCYATDLHCFLFAAMTVPFWCVVSWCMAEGGVLPQRSRALEIFKALVPLVVCALLSGLIALYIRAQYAVTDVAGGRSFEEIRLKSPPLSALLDYSAGGPVSHHFNIGIVVATGVAISVVVIGSFFVLMRRHRSERNPATLGRLLAGVLLVVGFVGTILLALGTNGPFDGLPIRIVRKLIPPYAMIRQPIKIFCILPTLAAMLFAVASSLDSIRFHRSRILRVFASLVFCVFAVIVGREGMSVGISVLPESNQAYRAVVERAEASGKTARALVLPSWPGDSAWSSVYEYYVMQNGLRMINGYSAVKATNYVDVVFHRFESATQGVIADDQLQALRGLGVTAVILHENAFPDKVSPFPVGVTLRRLLSHPNLKFIAQDRAVWSFEILDQPRLPGKDETMNSPPLFHAPARTWHFEASDGSEGQSPASLKSEEISASVWTPADYTGPTPSYLWLARMKGGGLDMRTGPYDTAEAGTRNQKSFPASDEWSWASLPAGSCGSDKRSWFVATGAAMISDVLFIKGMEDIRGPDEFGVIKLDVADFFHAGYTLRDENGQLSGVRFEPVHDPVAEIAYGPHLPLACPAGKLSIRAEGEWTSGDPSTFRVLLGGQNVGVGGIEDDVPFDYDGSSVLTIRFNYAGEQPVTLRSFVITLKH